MGKYRKKSVVIEAVQWNPSTREGIADKDGTELAIKTLEGWLTASPGDWIIKGIKGEFYPCKPDIFAATYEAVEQECHDELLAQVETERDAALARAQTAEDVGARYTSSAALQNVVVDHLAVAEERVRVLETALEAVEWVEDTYASDQNLDPVLICPWCGGTGTVVEPRPYILYPKGPPEPPRHKPDCKRQAALAKARREI